MARPNICFLISILLPKATRASTALARAATSSFGGPRFTPKLNRPPCLSTAFTRALCESRFNSATGQITPFHLSTVWHPLASPQILIGHPSLSPLRGPCRIFPTWSTPQIWQNFDPPHHRLLPLSIPPVPLGRGGVGREGPEEGREPPSKEIKPGGKSRPLI